MQCNSTITALLAEINELKEAQDLLERVWSEIGPYRDGKLTVGTWQAVRNFFGFDDSE